MNQTKSTNYDQDEINIREALARGHPESYDWYLELIDEYHSNMSSKSADP